MYKVIIVDDEPVIVKGLTRIIDWKKWNCEVIGTAESGQEGLKLIAEKNPDILISDICMPNLDGLSMIAAMRSEYERMQITILTGYRDFDYAQRAICLGVTRFLLKPSRIDEIEEAMQAMTARLAEEEEKDALASAAQSRGEAGAGEAAVCEGKENGREAEEDNPANSFIVRKALDYIEENYRQKLKLLDVADQIYVSQWHLSKLLNRYTGKSFSELLNNVRVERAKELLDDPALRISDVAEEVGFLDVAHFSRVFKKQTGISANEYRNSLAGK